MKAKCFSEQDKHLMVERVRANDTGIQNKTFKRYQLIEALTDPVTWLYVLLQVTSTLVIGGLGVFSNIIIKSFGFTTLQTQLLNIAQGGVTIIVMVGGASLATWTDRTVLVMQLWTLYSPLPRFQQYRTVNTEISTIGQQLPAQQSSTRSPLLLRRASAS